MQLDPTELWHNSHRSILRFHDGTSCPSPWRRLSWEVGGTEFGRTAITQGKGKDPGRDHHPHGYTVWLAGGGVKGGQVVGKTDDSGCRAVDDRVHVNDLHATLLHLFGLDHTKLTYRHQGADVRLTDVAGTVVRKLVA